MARVPNRWIDPATAFFYDWPVNHLEESPITKSRQMADGGATGNIGLVPQQGAATPLILTWKGTFFDDAQNAMNLYFWELCEDHSVHIRDFSLAEYNVIITDYEPIRKAVARNPRFPNLSYVWEFTLTMRVLQVIAGPWVGVTP